MNESINEVGNQPKVEFTLNNLDKDIELHLDSNPPTIKGWCFLFIALADIVCNLFGDSFFSTLIIDLFRYFFDLGDSVFITIILLQQLSLIVGGLFFLYKSNWQIYLRYALRESNIWSAFGLGQHIKGEFGLLLKERVIILLFELVVAAFLYNLFYPYFDILLNNSYIKNELVALLLILSMIIVGTWVFSSILRNILDASIIQAGILTFFFYGLVSLFNPTGIYELSNILNFRGNELDFFYVAEFIFLLMVVVLSATLSLGNITERLSPPVYLDSVADEKNTVINKLPNSLQGIRAKSFRVSLVHTRGDKLFVMSKPWTDKETKFSTHQSTNNLPIIARDFRFWNLTQLEIELEPECDFKREMQNGMYFVEADFKANALTSLFDNAPTFIDHRAVKKVEDAFYSISNKLGEVLMGEIDQKFSEHWSEIGFDSDLPEEEIDIASEIHKFERHMSNQIGSILPGSYEVNLFENISGGAQDERVEKINNIFEENAVKLDKLSSIFNDRSVKEIVENIRKSPDVIRKAFEFYPEKNKRHWSKVNHWNSDFYKASCDYLLDMLNIIIFSAEVKHTERFVDLEERFNSLQSKLTELIQQYWTEASTMEKIKFEKLLEKMPDGIAAKKFKDMRDNNSNAENTKENRNKDTQSESTNEKGKNHTESNNGAFYDDEEVE